MNRNPPDPTVDQNLDANVRWQSDLSPEGSAPEAPSPQPRLSAKSGRRIVLVKVTQIDWIESDDNCSRIWVGPDCLTRREPMYRLEDRLRSQGFTRISRSAIVNLDRISELEPLPHGEYEAILADGRQLKITRSYARQTRAALRI